jgi:hypothetical protein
MPTNTWSSPENELTWDALVELVDAIAGFEEEGKQASPEMWWAADIKSYKLGLDLNGQLELRRGLAVSPDGHHSVFMGERCQYCGANNLDVSLYAQDEATCPPVWSCGASHPDKDQLAHCQLLPEHTGDHTYVYYPWPHTEDLEGQSVMGEGPRNRVVVTWSKMSERDKLSRAYNDAHTLAVKSEVVNDALIEAVDAILGAREMAREELERLIDKWRNPERSPVSAGIVMRTFDGELVPFMRNGPAVSDVVALARECAHLDEDFTPGEGLAAAADSLKLSPYEVHLALHYVKEGVSPKSFGPPAGVYDPWDEIDVDVMRFLNGDSN